MRAADFRYKVDGAVADKIMNALVELKRASLRIAECREVGCGRAGCSGAILSKPHAGLVVSWSSASSVMVLTSSSVFLRFPPTTI